MHLTGVPDIEDSMNEAEKICQEIIAQISKINKRQ